MKFFQSEISRVREKIDSIPYLGGLTTEHWEKIYNMLSPEEIRILENDREKQQMKLKEQTEKKLFRETHVSVYRVPGIPFLGRMWVKK